MSLRVAYLVNQYPAVSHSFIRREILALENKGWQVLRLSVRGWDIPLVDPADQAERERTQYLLRGGWSSLGLALARQIARSPRRFLRALGLATRMAQRSDRPLLAHMAYLAEACKVLRFTREFGASHLHAHFATNPAEIAMLASELDGLTYSFTAHGSDIMDSPKQVGLEQTVRRASFVAAVCSFGRNQICRWVPHALWSKIVVVRCGLEPGYADHASELTAQQCASPVFVCVGRLSPEKGQLQLIDAARILAEEGIKPRIVLAGDGPMRTEVEASINAHGLQSSVSITGWLSADQIRSTLEDATALVVPSLSEGLPVVIMEAMATARPVVAPYLAGIPELVQHGATGWLYPAGDPTALASAIRDCISTPPAELGMMGRNARRRVWRFHDIRLQADVLSNLLLNR